MSALDALLSQVETSEKRYTDRNPARESAKSNIEKGDLAAANTTECIRERTSRLQEIAGPAIKSGSRSLETVGGATSNPRAVIENVALERILGSNDMMPISFLDLGRQRARSVGRIHIKTPLGMAQGFGTGFMVSPNLFLTNNHVLNEAGAAMASHVEFDFEVDLTGELRPTQTFQFDPETFFITDKTFDFTLVAIQANELFEPRQWGWIPLIQEDGLVVKGEYVSIIQHPNGEAKQLAMRENRVIDILDHFAHYQTDTAPGSSGSPVFNDQWELVALHHSGVPKRNANNKIESVDGRVWERWMGEHRIKWVANEGVKGKRISEFIRDASNLSASQKKLRDELFSIGPPPVVRRSNMPTTDVCVPPQGGSTTVDEQTDPASVSAQQTSSPIRHLASASGATMIVPLNITISLGGDGIGVQTPSDSSSMPLRASVISAPATVPPSDTDDSELNQALASLHRSKRKTYFDKSKDAAAQSAYYADIAPEGLSNAEMFDALSQQLIVTHTTAPRYRPSAHVYPWVDLHPDRQLRSIYSGKAFAPEKLIREDFRIQQERKMMLQELMKLEQELSPEDFENEVEMLEKQNPFNCEHVVPQSWYAKKEPMRGDLHHLFACESGCNSFRGNLGYFDFSDFEEATRTACGKRIDDRFEPSAGKGAVARATLYFLLRYPGKIDAPTELPVERISTLLNWHGEHDVTEYERHRNQAIFEIQGNRNPLIDHPEWAGKIDFKKGLQD